ncbi:TPA: hypothetical protein PXL76_002626 [Yersinia enterocolitica]|nr:hypothetical protein [Yersinia enterocolitica]HDL6891137.1 hypothetical protein [Yersinia enterocolitica]
MAASSQDNANRPLVAQSLPSFSSSRAASVTPSVTSEATKLSMRSLLLKLKGLRTLIASATK